MKKVADTKILMLLEKKKKKKKRRARATIIAASLCVLLEFGTENAAHPPLLCSKEELGELSYQGIYETVTSFSAASIPIPFFCSIHQKCGRVERGSAFISISKR